MAKQYYIKKDPTVDGPSVEWIAIDGKEFYQLITSSAGKGRYFIDMDDFMIETNKAEYMDWRKERNHQNYLREQQVGVQTVSLHSDLLSKNGSGEESISDEKADTEELAIRSIAQKALLAALNALDTESYQLINALFLSDDRKSERDIAAEFGVSQNAVNKRKNKILKNLKFLVVKLEKVSNRKMRGKTQGNAPRVL